MHIHINFENKNVYVDPVTNEIKKIYMKMCHCDIYSDLNSYN